MTLKTRIRFSVLVIVLLGMGSILILMGQKDTKTSNGGSHLTALPLSREEPQKGSLDDTRQRLEEVHSRTGVNSEITPEMLKRFRASRNEATLKKEWDALMEVPGRHSSKEWFAALAEFHRKAQARQVDYRSQAAQSKRDIQETKAAIQKTERIMAETAEMVAESRRRTAEAIARYEARFADPATSQTPSENDHTDDSLNTVPSPEPPEGALTSPTEVSAPPHSEARRDPVSETFIRDTFLDEMAQWQEGINKSYPDVLIAEDLPLEAFNSIFSTEASRMELQARQRQMQADIAHRVQSFLAEDAPGNRDQKLSIIRQTLSATWSEEIADSVIERLK